MMVSTVASAVEGHIDLDYAAHTTHVVPSHVLLGSQRLLGHLQVRVAITCEGERAIVVLDDGVLRGVLAIGAEAIADTVAHSGSIGESHQTVGLGDVLGRAVDLGLADHIDDGVHGGFRR